MKPIMQTSNNFLDRVLPTYGNQRERIPIYNDEQKMFMSPTYTSESGNIYYRGIRLSDRMVMVEYIGIFKNWTYIDRIELYTFNGKERELISRKEFDKKFYNMEEIRKEAELLTYNYLKSQKSLSDASVSDEQLTTSTNEIMNQMYQNQIENIQRLAEVSRLMLAE